MSGLSQINRQHDTLLPAVYRRTDVARHATTTRSQALPGPSGGHPVDGSHTGYRRLTKNRAAPVESGADYPTGMIIDIWV